MDRAEWQIKFKDQCYMPAAKLYSEQLLLDIAGNAPTINKELNGQVDAFFQSLCLLQENGKLGPVRTVSISFPYTSLEYKAPYLLFEVYPDHPFIDDMEVAREFPVSWLYTEWDLFLERVYEDARTQGMSSIIRKPYIKAHAWGTARVILKIVSGIVKSHFYGMDDMSSYRQLQKADEFTLFFGEYMDWQRPVAAYREEIDIFFCDEKADLRFRRFLQAWYEDKNFDNLVLDDCRFENCTFQNCQINGCSFRDARLIGCTFNNVSFSGLKLAGARFDGCKFEDVSMTDIQTNSFADPSPSQAGMHGMTEFIGCFIRRIQYTSCDFSASYYQNCRIDDAASEDSQLPDSFNDCLM